MGFCGDIITSKSNNFVIKVNKLLEKKNRDCEREFRFDGIKLFLEAVNFDVPLETIVLSQSAALKFYDEVRNKVANYPNLEIKVLSDDVFSKVSEEKSPEGIICVAKYIDKLHKIDTINNENPDYDRSLDYLNGKTVFASESIRDPGNLGTIIRTCGAFGVDALILSADCADIYNSKTVRAAMGALFRQNILRVDSLPAVLRALSANGRMTYATTLGKKAVLLGNENISKDACIVVGNEGHGLTNETKDACKKNILIPMSPDSESLNAAVASSIILWEQFKQILN